MASPTGACVNEGQLFTGYFNLLSLWSWICPMGSQMMLFVTLNRLLLSRGCSVCVRARECVCECEWERDRKRDDTSLSAWGCYCDWLYLIVFEWDLCDASESLYHPSSFPVPIGKRVLQGACHSYNWKNARSVIWRWHSWSDPVLAQWMCFTILFKRNGFSNRCKLELGPRGRISLALFSLISNQSSLQENYVMCVPMQMFL